MSFFKNCPNKYIVTAILSCAAALCGTATFALSEREQLLEKNLAPIGTVNVVGGSANAVAQVVIGPDTGKQIYNKGCAVCHAVGAAGSPKFGDKAAWAPRIAEGEATLIQHALHGFKGMPAKGACPSCADEEIKAAVDYMISAAK
jgi:cytochrome c5